jgi:hypothetical protein
MQNRRLRFLVPLDMPAFRAARRLGTALIERGFTRRMKHGVAGRGVPPEPQAADDQELERRMSRFARVVLGRELFFAVRGDGPVIAPSAGELGRVSALTLALAWFARLSRRGTLAYYRARHRPLAGPAPGARLPQ